jgi:hypothetical protein
VNIGQIRRHDSAHNQRGVDIGNGSRTEGLIEAPPQVFMNLGSLSVGLIWSVSRTTPVGRLRGLAPTFLPVSV